MNEFVFKPRELFDYTHNYTIHFRQDTKTFDLEFPINCYQQTDIWSYGEPLFSIKFSQYKLTFKQLKILMDLYDEFTEDNYKKIFPDSNLFEILRFKAENWNNHDVQLAPIIVYHSDENVEFLECDENTSFYGNYPHPDFRNDEDNEKEGCYMRYGKHTYSTNQIKDLNIHIDISIYNFTDDEKKTLRDNGIIDLYKVPDSNIIDIIIKYLGYDCLIRIMKHQLKYNDLFNYKLDYTKPYRITLFGNDDCSYTKYFSTEETMMQEVYRLRRCQPINMEIDVENNGYHYTN